jgi:polysaccharide pyruvyl transferase WcaK-like protein
VAVWGTFDLDTFGDQLYPRITEDEIVRRLPGWMVRTYSPFGWERPCRMDGGFVAEPLGERDESRLTGLAAAADLTLVGGGDIVHFDTDGLAGAYGVDPSTLARRSPGAWYVSGLGATLEQRHPVIWNAVGVPAEPAPNHAELIRDALSRRRYIAVRDEVSARRLRDCGVEKDIAVVPDLGVLVHRLMRAEVQRPRVDYFRLMGWYPVDRPALIVQADRSAVPLVKEIAKVLRWALGELLMADIVLLETDPSHGDGEFLDLLAEQLDPKRTYRLPAGLPPEDVLAAIHGSIGTVATSYHATLASAMLGRRWAVLDTSAAIKPLAELLEQPDHYATSADELAEAIRVAFPKQPDPKRYSPLRDQVDKHFDVVAEEAERVWLAGGGNSEHRWADVRRENIQLRAAYRTGRQRLAAERRKLLDQIHVGSDGAAFSSVPPEEIARLKADSAELERLRHTKLLRWSTPARRIYGRLK